MRPLDTVRLEVLTNGDKELFASPGDRKFSEGHPISYAGSGMLDNGLFALYLKDTLVTGNVSNAYKRGRGDRRAPPGVLRLPAAADVERSDGSDSGGVRQGGPPRLVLGGPAVVRCVTAGTERRRFSAHVASCRSDDEHQLCANPSRRPLSGAAARVRRSPPGEVFWRDQAQPNRV